MRGRRIVIGTRGSALALAQAKAVAQDLVALHPEVRTEIRVIRTTGDRVGNKAFGAIGGRGLFTRELDEAVLSGGIDCAVHSLKDLPSQAEDGVEVAAITACLDPRDALLSRSSAKLDDLAAGAVVGTASVRRSALLLSLKPSLSIRLLRGNIDTRIRRMDEGRYEAILVAAAGLRRLGLEGRVAEYLDPEIFVPAAGQGRLAVTARTSSPFSDVLSSLDDPSGRIASEAEREFLRLMGGGCQVPIGCLGSISGETLRLTAVFAFPASSRVLRASAEGGIRRGADLARRLAERMMQEGAAEMLGRIDAKK